MPYRTRAHEILEQWREVERKHDAATDPATRSWLQAEMETLRRTYQEVVEEARVAQMPDRPAFPESSPQAG